jgi:hypothetical protein
VIIPNRASIHMQLIQSVNMFNENKTTIMGFDMEILRNLRSPSNVVANSVVSTYKNLSDSMETYEIDFQNYSSNFEIENYRNLNISIINDGVLHGMNNIYIYIYVYVYIYLCVHIYMYICVYFCMYIYVCVYI